MKIKAIAGLFVAVFITCFSPVIASPIEHVEKIIPPVNDDCANAIDLTVNTDYLCGSVTSGTLADATASTAPSGCPGTDVSDAGYNKANDDVWFKFTATKESHKISIDNFGGTFVDPYHMVYDGGAAAGSCATMTPIFCSDPESSMLTSLTIGNVYFIRVYSDSNASGATLTFDICIGTAPAPPANDDCANAIDATMPFTQTVDASGSTNNTGFITATGCIDLNDGVWFKVTGNGGDITVAAGPTGWNAGIGVYTGTCGSFVCVADSNLGGNNVVESLTFSSTNAVTYYVNIAHPSGTVDAAEGIFAISITSSTLSIDDLLTKGFKYFPNPVKDVLRMRANENIDRISIYSILGREIKQVLQSELQANVDLSNLSAGTYFVKAYIGENTGTFKIIKE